MTQERVPKHDAALDRHLQAENAHDLAAIIETFSESSEVIWAGRSYRGLTAIRRLHEGMGFGDGGAFSELRVVERRRYHVGQTIIVEQSLHGRHTGTWEGVAATGKLIDVPVCTVYDFDDNETLISERPYLDRWLVWTQLKDGRT